MRAETVLLDDTNQISRVQNEEDRAQNRALRDSAHECSDDKPMYEISPWLLWITNRKS